MSLHDVNHVESWARGHLLLANIHDIRHTHRALTHKNTWRSIGDIGELMSRGSVEAGKGCKRVREGKDRRARNLWGEAIKKPVLNYRSDLPPHT